MNTRQSFSKVMFVSFIFSILIFLIGANGYGVIQISSLDDLKNIGNDASYPLDGEYELTQDIDASATMYWNAGLGFNPIGSSSNPFSGTFNGNGYKITGLVINRVVTDYVGLFRYIGSTGKVYDLQIDTAGIFGRDDTGVLCGYNKGRIERCYVTGGTTVGGEDHVGGLVGGNGGTVTQSYSTGSVSGNSYVGGLVGYNDDSGTVTQSYSTGSVTGTGGYVGGLVGFNGSGATITQSYSTGSVSGINYVGGLVGENWYGTVTQSYSTGSVTGTGDYVGGLVGENWYGTVTQSYATGSVSGNRYVGGLVGSNGSGTVTQSYSTGSVSGSSYVGGLVGSGGTVTQSYWDKETSGQTTSAGGGTGKTTAEMKQQATYVGWNFVTIWGIVENETYPYLKTVPKTKSVPSVIGMTQVMAESTISSAGFLLGTVGNACSNEVETGKVISQSPSAGLEYPEGSRINIVISTGPCEIQVPNVVGMTEAEARDTIELKGLVFSKVEECNNSVLSGRVIRQTPSAGSNVLSGATVQVVVSTGPCPVSVPNVVGMTRSSAESVITGAGLTVGTVTERCDNVVPSGNVVSQSPSGNEQVLYGSSVNIFVSTGPCPVPVPEVVGKSESEARNLISSAGLTVIKEEEYSEVVPAGNVTRQHPSAGENILYGSTVTIWVSKGKDPSLEQVVVPNVVGVNTSEATDALERFGFVVHEVTEYSSEVNKDIVLGQSPSGGSMLSKGSTVDIVVSLGPDPTGGSGISEPRNLYAYAGLDSVYLIWEASVSRGVIGYRLERSATPGVENSWESVSGETPIEQTSYRDDIGGRTGIWYYRVIAIGEGDKRSKPSDTAQVSVGELRVEVPDLDYLVTAVDRLVRVPVTVSHVGGFVPYTIDIEVSYDGLVLEAVGVELTAVSRNMLLTRDITELGKVKVGMAPRQDTEQKVLYGEGHLFDMVFRVKEGVGQSACSQDVNIQLTQVSIKDTSLQQEVPVSRRDGVLTILTDVSCITNRCLYGDVNGDGVLGMSDALLLLRKVVRKSSLSTDRDCEIKRGDMNGDGLLDSADVSLLMRKLSGLPVNPTGTGVSLLSSPSSRTVQVVVDNNSVPNAQGEYSVGIELSSVSGVSGVDLVLAIEEGLSFSRWSLGDVVSDFDKDSEVGVGYVKININSSKELTGTGKERLVQLYFKPALTKVDGKDVRIQLRDVKIKGQHGDDFNWYGSLKKEDGVVKVNVSDQFVADVKDKFDEIDANGDGKISYTEAESKYPGLSQDVFDNYDTNGDGYIDKVEAGITVPLEGSVDGAKEGEGQVQEGGNEGQVQEGGKEGQAGTEGSPSTSEGEGSTETPTETAKGCGCGSKSLGNDMWWKYLLDVILFGMLIVSMSGMRRRR